MVTSPLPPSECLLSVRSCVSVTPSFTVWGISDPCNFCVALTRPEMCYPGPPVSRAVLVQSTSGNREVAWRALLALKKQVQGRKGHSVWILKAGLAQVLDVDILLRTSVLTASRAGARSFSALPACAVFALVHTAFTQVTVRKTIPLNCYTEKLSFSQPGSSDFPPSFCNTF